MTRSTFEKALARGLGLALALLVTLPVAATAQMMMDHEGEPPGLEAARRQYESVRDYIVQAAENTPEELYAYRPTEEVRSLGELYGHIGNAGYRFCANVLDEDTRAPTDLEEATRDQIIQGLRDSFAYCDRAYSEVSHQQLHEETTLFGRTGPKIWVLTFNATHNWEHYGNIVTYLRMNGMVPPSSGGMQGDGM